MIFYFSTVFREETKWSKKNTPCMQRSKFSLLTSHSMIRLFFSYTARLKIAVVFFAGLLNFKSTAMWVIFIN